MLEIPDDCCVQRRSANTADRGAQPRTWARRRSPELGRRVRRCHILPANATLTSFKRCHFFLSGSRSVGEEERTKEEGTRAAGRSEKTRRSAEAHSREERARGHEGRSQSRLVHGARERAKNQLCPLERSQAVQPSPGRRRLIAAKSPLARTSSSPLRPIGRATGQSAPTCAPAPVPFKFRSEETTIG
jgi:hypothetical protein